MKVTLVHNPKSGGGKGPDRKELVEVLRSAGHEVEYVSLKDKDWEARLATPAEAIVVAGGDGAVGKVARRVAGGSIPLALLPLGTANNVATTLGLVGAPVARLAAGWASARRVPFDLGTARGPWGETPFLESVGIGLFPRVMAALDDGRVPGVPDDDTGKKLAFARWYLGERARDSPARRLKVTLDGRDLSGEYVLAEVLNTRFCGPNLDLAPAADPGDGRLDVVLAGADERATLAAFLAPHPGAATGRTGLTAHRGETVRIEWNGADLHIDDDPRPAGDTATEWIELSVQRHVVEFLVPCEKTVE